jgi:hypothetical protein
MNTFIIKLNYFIKDILIDNDYEIDTNAELHIQFQQYLLRYRRIIGMIMLVILISIMYYCNDYSSIKQNGGDNAEMIKKIQDNKRFAQLKAESNAENAKQAANAAAEAGKARTAAVFGQSKIGQSLGSTGIGAKLIEMKAAGKTKGQMAYALGGMAADKFKEFATWLYEILFAIAISIAICMIVVPSLSFFALGLVCYFLLRSKISTIKGL